MFTFPRAAAPPAGWEARAILVVTHAKGLTLRILRRPIRTPPNIPKVSSISRHPGGNCRCRKPTVKPTGAHRKELWYGNAYQRLWADSSGRLSPGVAGTVTAVSLHCAVSEDDLAVFPVQLAGFDRRPLDGMGSARRLFFSAANPSPAVHRLVAEPPEPGSSSSPIPSLPVVHPQFSSNSPVP